MASNDHEGQTPKDVANNTAKVVKDKASLECSHPSPPPPSTETQISPSVPSTASHRDPSTMKASSKMNGTALIVTEPDPATLYPDVDLSNIQNVTRLLSLFQTGWTLSHGHGPREQDTCLWCRGPMASEVQILTHAGKENGCRNSWHATCLLQWLEGEFKSGHVQRLRCPMCRIQFFRSSDPCSIDFHSLSAEELEEAGGFLNAAWVRFVVFSPDYAKDICVKTGKTMVIMSTQEVKQLRLWGTTRYAFETIAQITSTHAKSRASAGYVLERMKARALRIAAYKRNKNGDNDENSDEEIPEVLDMETTWVMIDWGNNEFRMGPYLADDANAMKKTATDAGVSIQEMTAQEFNEQATQRGGLRVAVQNHKADGGELGKMKESGEQFVRDILDAGPHKGQPDALKKYQWYTRIAIVANINHDPDHRQPWKKGTLQEHLWTNPADHAANAAFMSDSDESDLQEQGEEEEGEGEEGEEEDEEEEEGEEEEEEEEEGEEMLPEPPNPVYFDPVKSV